jgi:multiple sugar transport system substrate-binding protein
MLLFYVAMFVTAVLLTRCSGGSGGKTALVFWQFWPVEVIQPLVDQFQQQNPDVTVRVERLTWDTGLQKISAAVASGKVPDLCEVGSTEMPRFLASGALVDWTVAGADLRPQLHGWQLCTASGRVQGLPWVLGTRALFYNKTLFARAGLDSTHPPETWEELRRAAEAIEGLGGDAHGYGVQAGERKVLFKKFMPFAWGNGGRVLSDDLARAELDSRENREALDFYLGLRKVGVMDRQDMLDRAFKEGRLGMELSGGWLLRSVPAEAPDLRFGVALVPRPARGRGTHSSFAGGEVLVSFVASKQKEAALRLARFLVQGDHALALASSAKSVQPCAVGMDTSAYYREHPHEQMLVRQLATAVFTPNHPAWVEMEAAIEDQIEQALYDKKSAAQALADAQKQVAALLSARP